MSSKSAYIFAIAAMLIAIPLFVFAQTKGTIGASETVTTFEGFQDSFLGFLDWLFPVMIAAAALIATLSIIFAGFQWMAGAISPPQIEAAKSRIGAAVFGLFIALLSWIILNTINPTFTQLEGTEGFPLGCFDEEGERIKCPSLQEALFGLPDVGEQTFISLRNSDTAAVNKFTEQCRGLGGMTKYAETNIHGGDSPLSCVWSKDDNYILNKTVSDADKKELEELKTECEEQGGVLRNRVAGVGRSTRNWFWCQKVIVGPKL